MEPRSSGVLPAPLGVRNDRPARRGGARCRGGAPRLPILAFVLFAFHAMPAFLPEAALAAQEETALPDSVRERIARADSIRAAMVQPPGDRNGLTAMDLVRAPVDLVGAALATVVVPLNWSIRQLGLIVEEPDQDAAERDRPDFDVDVTTLGSRSWPALEVSWHTLHPLFLEAAYSLRQYERYGGGFAFGTEEGTGAELAARYHVLRELHFWGIGTDAASADRSDFALTRAEAGASGWTDLGADVHLGLGVARERNDVDRGFDTGRPDVHDVFAEDAVPGLGETTDFYRVDGSLEVDLTRVRGPQLDGFRLLGVYQLFRGADETEADFHRVRGDLRTYLSVTPRHMIGARLLVEDRLRERGGAVPFTHLAELGDDDGLRGFTSRRFRDRALLAGQLEWRYEVWWHPGDPLYRLEGFVFGDYGAVAPELGDLEEGDFRFTPGLGLRLIHAGTGLGEAFVAFGGDDVRIDTSLSITF